LLAGLLLYERWRCCRQSRCLLRAIFIADAAPLRCRIFAAAAAAIVADCHGAAAPSYARAMPCELMRRRERADA